VRIVGALVLAAIGIGSLLPSRAEGGLTPALLGDLAAKADAGATLPLGLRFRDERGASLTLGEALGGRAAVLIFSDYTCRTLCGPILEFTAAGLEHSGLAPGIDYRLVVIGLNPKDGIADARAMRDAHLDPGSRLAGAATLLIGEEPAVRAVAKAAGYQYAYDAERDQFAHPAAVYVITPEGRVARVLSALGLDGNDLRLALVEAGEGRVGGFIDHVRLLCYGFDPAQGIYTSLIEWWLMAAAASTVLALAGWLALLSRSSRGGTA
jgi:protein SCO1/2